MNEKASCSEMLARLEDEWDTLWEGEQAYLMSRLVSEGCREVAP
jgi:hypothetical protein